MGTRKLCRTLTKCAKVTYNGPEHAIQERKPGKNKAPKATWLLCTLVSLPTYHIHSLTKQHPSLRVLCVYHFKVQNKILLIKLQK